MQYIPTCYYDGGESVRVGGYGADTAVFAYAYRLSYDREVPALDLDISMTWLSITQVEVTVTVTNNNFVNFAPDGPDAPIGPIAGLTGEDNTFSVIVVDPDGDDVYFRADWDGEIGDWFGPIKSGEAANLGHVWEAVGAYSVSVQAKDIYDYESPWSNGSEVIKIVDRGDANGDFTINVGDASFMVNTIFKGGPQSFPELASDANCDLANNVGDVVHMVNYIFKGGPAPGCSE